MANLKQHIAVLYGGDSAEREVSLNSGKAIANGLEQAGFEKVTLIDTQGFELSQLKAMGVDRAFIALHGKGGEDGTIQGALEYLGVPYTGTGVLGSALCMDKVRCKQIWQGIEYPTANFKVVEKDTFDVADCQAVLTSLGGKAMVKPATEGSSIGMSIADSSEKLESALTEAFNFDDSVLVEAFIDGPEYTVAILGEQVLPAIHMETPNEFYDYQAKYQSNTTQYHCPCDLTEAEETELQKVALKAFKSVSAQGWGRVDVMRTQDGKWRLLEVNTVPGMTETSLVPKAAKVEGYSFSDLVRKIVELSEA